MTNGGGGPLRMVIAGGGTGGHVLPALAVVEELRARDISMELLWIGSNGDTEGPAARNAGIPFRTVPVGKLRRYVDLQTVPDAAKVPAGVVQAWRILRGFGPDVIFSTGGFVSVPSVVAGSRMAPTLTHEQTAILGLATQVNLKFAHQLALSFNSTQSLVGGYRGKVTVTGNPVRPSLLDGDADRGRAAFGLNADLPLVYVTGGARGATPINTRIQAMLPGLLEVTQVLHQTGPATANDDAQILRDLQATWPEELSRRYVVREFVRDEIADVFAATDLVVSRSGAGTVAELAVLGKPAIMIPLPGSGGGEQNVNAKYLEDAGAAIVIDQEDATPERLEREIRGLLADRQRLAGMGEAARRVARPDAAARLADLLLQMAGRGPEGR